MTAASIDASGQNEAHSKTMRAITHSRYGGPEVLELVDIARPEPTEGRVLVEVRAASLNALDWHLLTGTPYFLRLMNGLRTPKRTGIGVDFAGVVEAVGPGVEGLKPGDAVFGAADGTCAEYATPKAEYTLPLPEGVEFDQAATFNVAAITALQGLRDVGEVKAGQRVLVNGAAGGVGTYAVQIAKLLGAHVTAVCSGRNAELVRSLGADEVIDYTSTDVSRLGETFDVILDNAGSQSASKLARMLEPDGIAVVITGPKKGKVIGPVGHIARSKLRFMFGSRRGETMNAETRRADLEQIGRWVADGSIMPVIHQTYSLDETVEAVRLLGSGHAPAKLVIKP
jgi:NADPH:quinone reductase-like Zn-dependent oxidoreductase